MQSYLVIVIVVIIIILLLNDTLCWIQDEDGDEPIPEDTNADYKPDLAHHPQAMPEPAENYGKSQEKTETMQEQSIQEDAGKSEEEKNKEVWDSLRVLCFKNLSVPIYFPAQTLLNVMSHA